MCHDRCRNLQSGEATTLRVFRTTITLRCCQCTTGTLTSALFDGDPAAQENSNINYPSTSALKPVINK